MSPSQGNIASPSKTRALPLVVARQLAPISFVLAAAYRKALSLSLQQHKNGLPLGLASKVAERPTLPLGFASTAQEQPKLTLGLASMVAGKTWRELVTPVTRALSSSITSGEYNAAFKDGILASDGPDNPFRLWRSNKAWMPYACLTSKFDETSSDSESPLFSAVRKIRNPSQGLVFSYLLSVVSSYCIGIDTSISTPLYFGSIPSFAFH